MLSPNFTILYVRDALASASFYTRLLGREPVESAPTFAMFALDGGVMLGLWTRAGVEPAPVVEAGAVELGFVQPDRAAVDALHQRWIEQGLTIAQAPTVMDFGYTFAALDPDGHRLRVFNPTPDAAQ
ncbi:VOC family protein [Paucibacter sp. APW11]|uniref:VOC family protein n=1 Tax=Roseateles aquae TaxID=3077235 RepID=A0ABU3P8T1_9BURK|nr:VOC family protein [Paucibacter sp. APW11]MDT8998982.1 VOC family protein [Paucibacter sp. APW11]